MSDILIRPHFDANGKDYAVEHLQDVQPILEWNKEARTQDQPSDWGRHVGRVPNVIMIQWLNEEHARGNTSLRMFSAEFDQLIWKKLQDPEWVYLRTDRPKLQAGWSAGLL